MIYLKFAIITLVLYTAPVFAYIGPGLGAGTLGIIFGFLISIFLALFSVFWYPLKRLFRKNDDKKEQPES